MSINYTIMVADQILDHNPPKIGLGTFNLYGSQCKDVVSLAISMGYRHIDTAQVYDNESAIGCGINDCSVPRDHLYITTKIGIEEFSRERFIPAVEDSLRRLKTSYIDLLLLHWPSVSEATNLVALEQLNLCQEKGYCAHIGVSNFPLKELTLAIQKSNIICNQIEYHTYLHQHKLLNFMQQNHLWITAFSPLAMGKVLRDPLIIELAHQYNRTPGQIALRWLIQQNGVSAIPKASSIQHLRENLDVFGFAIKTDDVEKINGLQRNLRLVEPAWAPDWDDNESIY